MPVVRKSMSSSISVEFRCRIDQRERLKSSLTAVGLVCRQENHADKLREGRDEVSEYDGEERPDLSVFSAFSRGHARARAHCG
jgi:hypothetical protein